MQNVTIASEASTFNLRKASIVQNVTTTSEVSTFNLRKVKQAVLAAAEGILSLSCRQ
ncbi:hypothetical protein [Pseudoalteromonas luteoviolacea]|uniref:hypothetical protein n=1 Tax=Pseudoalteromonas luteoviolacea TaxID=43657 RepID=UPI000B32BFF9|nr:hypothetical protein [Pseudoalteromonas luteoviolacea]